MAETTAPIGTRARPRLLALGSVVMWALAYALALIVTAELVFFGIHAVHLLGYPYPLDYGEGPLLAQVNLLRAGTPVWRLYADPSAPPYAIVNYPPVYHLLAALVAPGGENAGSPLQAGRLISLIATLAAVVALWMLSDNRSILAATAVSRRWSVVTRMLIVLAFVGLPIVREWAVLMRVDMLGLSLGLWGLVLVQRGTISATLPQARGRIAGGEVLLAAIPLTLSLFVKPSLIAAPAAALLWLLFRDWRRALWLGLLIAAGGGMLFASLQIASDGWFALHILAANANDWRRNLATGFWHDQMVILWPLLVAAGLGFLAQRLETRDRRYGDTETTDNERNTVLLALYYTLFGAIGALGVGKVGAYTNYFLEFYAGLIWLAASATRPASGPPSLRLLRRLPSWSGDQPARPVDRRAPHFTFHTAHFTLQLLVPLFVIGALLHYYPTWSENYLKLAGIIEKTNPPRVSFGQYGVWRDLGRERDILATLNGVNAALVSEVRAAGAPIFTDVPGVAAQAGQLARLQAFESRQLLDMGRWDQRPLLRDLANGRVPLAVLDYLGNWLTPEMITLITHRYAQDGSRGTYDIYRPVAPGPLAAADIAFPGGLRLVGYHLALPDGRPLYHGGETVLITLDWRRDQAARVDEAQTNYEVVAQITDGQGNVLLETARPLLYRALPPPDWGDDIVQHMQPIALPPELPAMTYDLAITLRVAGHDLAPPRTITPIVVEEQGGRLIGELGYFVPALFLESWEQAGGAEGPGDPLMPATPFQGYTMQCFVRACLRLDGGGVRRLPLGELIHLGDVGLRQPPTPAGESRAGATALRFPESGQTLDGLFLEYWRDHGAEEALGPPITPELVRGDWIVQYTRYARLERPLGGGVVRLGRLGEEYLRLPGGVAYRWP